MEEAVYRGPWHHQQDPAGRTEGGTQVTQDLIQGSDEWHKERAARLTGSNFAAAMGINPYQSRQKLYRQLTGEDPRFEGNEMTEWGVDHEDDAVHAYEASQGVFVDKTGFHVHPEYDWLGVSPDGLVGDMGLIECKCRFNQELWEEVPAHYMAQIQGQLVTANRLWCDFVSWAPDGLSVFRVPVSGEYWSAMFPLLEKFYKEWQAGTEPKRAKKPVLPEINYKRIL